MLSALLAAALWIGPAHSGSWYTPERNGEGFTLEILDNGTAHAIWFTYPPAGAAAQQAWIYASGGRIDEDRIVFEGALTTRGPRFGPGYDPSQVQLIPWGRIEFRFTGCNEGEFTYAGPAGWGSGTRRVTRLSSVAELECGGKRRLVAQGARALEGLRARSGAWFDPTHNGEGWQIEELPDGRSLVYWFTYDERGEQAWTVGESATSGASMVVANNLRPVGTRFGAGFDAAQVRLEPWGRVEIDLTTCAGGTLRYQSSQTAFGSGTLAPARLTTLAGAPCLDGTPQVPSGGRWSTGAPQPVATSESAVGVVGGMAYVAGGFGGLQTFQRYDADRDSWTVLAPLPGGRDHPLATAVGDTIYVTGGDHHGGDHSNGWRYRIAEGRWENAPELPFNSRAGAATLGGFAYFADIIGRLTQFNPATGRSRVIPGDGFTRRDHSQLVAFQGELWMIGGRSGETNRVSIYDPASETWRHGPALVTPRAGFAAAASPTLLVVGGGEVLTPGLTRTLDSVEAIAAGQGAWSALPAMPTAVHGVVGMLRGNAFYLLGGSTVAGTIGNPGTVQILRW